MRLSASPSSALRDRLSAFPHPGLTLIELLVTIVILVTLLAAVLPAVSPNNEGRKIREAARQLSSLLAQAQAQAARDGRRVGVGFNDTETWIDADDDGYQDVGEVTYTGMALAAYIIAEPPPFTGFSTSSAAGFVRLVGDNSEYYADRTDNLPRMPSSTLPNMPPIINLVFGHGVGGEGMVYSLDPSDKTDAIPPGMFRGAEIIPEGTDRARVEGSGDLIAIGNELFEILINDCDDADDTDSDPDVETINGVDYVTSQNVIAVRWLTWKGRPAPRDDGDDSNGHEADSALLPRGGRAYRIRRQPMAQTSPSRSAAEALQFPRGVGVDFDPTKGNGSIGIVFSPVGTVDAVYEDGSKETLDEPFFILLGRIENSNPRSGDPPDIDYTRYDFRMLPDDDEMAQRRGEVNLLSPDSRWVIVTPAGRVLSAENASFDPRTLLLDSNDPSQGLFLDSLSGTEAEQLEDQRERYREEAQRYAAQLQTEGGN